MSRVDYALDEEKVAVRFRRAIPALLLAAIVSINGPELPWDPGPAAGMSLEAERPGKSKASVVRRNKDGAGRDEEESVAVRFERAQGGAVLIANIAGVYTVESSRAMRREVFAEGQARPMRILIVDFTRAVLAMGPQGMQKLAEQSFGDGTPPPVAAFVVSPACVAAARAYCAALAVEGLVRVTVTSIDAALEWAALLIAREDGAVQADEELRQLAA